MVQKEAVVCGAAGVTHALAAIFSFGQRQQLLPFASQMWAEAAKLLDSRAAASSVVARKFAIKLVQRIGLSFLPATVAAWRYQQTSVNINDSLKNAAPIAIQPAQGGATPSQNGVQTADTPHAAHAHSSGHDADAQSSEPYRGALQPSQFVNVQGPVSPAPAKAASPAQATQQRPGDSEPMSLNGPEVEEEDIEVPEEIEEVSACLFQLHP